MLFQKPGGVSAALALKGPLLVSTESHPVRSGVLSEYRGPGAGRAAPARVAWPRGLGWGWEALRVGRGEGTRSPPRTLPQPRTRAHPSASRQLGKETLPGCHVLGAPERWA